jgi:hypothetical protein
MTLTPFMKFWKTLNEVMADRGQPEVLFGDAHAYWLQFADKAWAR